MEEDKSTPIHLVFEDVEKTDSIWEADGTIEELGEERKARDLQEWTREFVPGVYSAVEETFQCSKNSCGSAETLLGPYLYKEHPELKEAPANEQFSSEFELKQSRQEQASFSQPNSWSDGSWGFSSCIKSFSSGAALQAKDQYVENEEELFRKEQKLKACKISVPVQTNDESTCFIMYEHLRSLEDENKRLRVELSYCKEENLYLRETLERYSRRCSGMHSETTTSTNCPESEEDSSSNVNTKRKKRRKESDLHDFDMSLRNFLESCGRETDSACNQETSKGSCAFASGCSIESGATQRNDREVCQTDKFSTNPADFVNLVRNLTEPLTKVDPARAATLTMFILALALGVFNHHNKACAGGDIDRLQWLPRDFWSNIMEQTKTSASEARVSTSDAKFGMNFQCLCKEPNLESNYLERSQIDEFTEHFVKCERGTIKDSIEQTGYWAEKTPVPSSDISTDQTAIWRQLFEWNEPSETELDSFLLSDGFM